MLEELFVKKTEEDGWEEKGRRGRQERKGEGRNVYRGMIKGGMRKWGAKVGREREKEGWRGKEGKEEEEERGMERRERVMEGK